MADKANDLVRITKRRVKVLEGWGWAITEVAYRYGPKGTGSARSFIMAERGNHGVTLEYLFRLNNRYGPPVKFVGGFWDGGPIRSAKELEQLASPLETAYNHRTGTTSKRGAMPTATEPRKRTAKKAAAATNGAARKRVARKPVVEDEEDFIEEEAPKRRGRPKGDGPTKGEIAALERAERQAAKAEAHAENVAEVVRMRDEGMGWDEIAEAMGKSHGLCLKFYYWHLAREEDGGNIPEPTVDDIVADREAGLSYPQIEVKYDITRQKVWAFLDEAGIDHFESDIGKGGRYVKRDPEVVAERQALAAQKRAEANPNAGKGRGRGRKPKFQGFTDETPDEDILDAVEGKKITWNKARGDGTDSAVAKEGTVEIKTDKRKQRGLTFSDGRKTRTCYVKNIVSIG